MNQRGFGIIAYAVLALAILAAIGGIIAWADRNIATTAGVNKGRVEVKTQWDAANEAARQREAEASAKAAAELEAERKKRKVVIKERTIYVDREIEKLVDSGTCFKPDGVRAVNCAIRGESADRCKPDGSVPAPRPPG